MQKKNTYIGLVLILLMMIVNSCNHQDGVGIKLIRYDKLQYEYALYNSFTVLQKINKEFPQQTKLLIEDVLSICDIDDPDINYKLFLYNQDTLIRKVRTDVETTFTDLSAEERQFTNVFTRLQKEIPNLHIPLIYTQMSGFNQSIVVGDSILGISLDKYLGTDYPLYPLLYHDFQIKSMRRERIVPDVLTSYLQVEYPLPSSIVYTLMDKICYEGKINWIVYKTMKAPSLEWFIDFDEKQTAWCEEHKTQICGYLMRDEIRYSTEFWLIRKFLMPSPYTKIYGMDSPSEIGQWLGIHIIDSYMKKHPDVTIEKLLHNHNYSQLLNESGFMP